VAEGESETGISEETGQTGLDATQAPAARQPGWYPGRTNPNEQSYWDGDRYTNVRHWVAGRGWVDGEGGMAHEGEGPTPETRLSANPYVPPVTRRSRRAAAPATFSLAVLLTLVSGVALMFGSVGTWVHVTGSVGVANFHLSVNGLDPGISTLIGVNGYVTFIGGIVLVVFGGLALSSEERLLVILTNLVALAILIFAVYDMFRIVQKISQVQTGPSADISVGWGLICVLSAAVLAMVVSLARLVNQR
jgi:hypothetical protein